MTYFLIGLIIGILGTLAVQLAWKYIFKKKLDPTATKCCK